MNTRELRIGNFLHHKGLLIIVSDLHKNGVIEFNEESESGFWNDKNESCTPIPLTEEWLMHLGFMLIFDDMWCKSTNKISFDIVHSILDKNKPETMGWYLCVDEMPRYAKIEYVHELQNIYHGLTKENLVNNNNK